jgi:hypothetical protein
LQDCRFSLGDRKQVPTVHQPANLGVGKSKRARTFGVDQDHRLFGSGQDANHGSKGQDGSLDYGEPDRVQISGDHGVGSSRLRPKIETS